MPYLILGKAWRLALQAGAVAPPLGRPAQDDRPLGALALLFPRLGLLGVRLER